MKINLYINNAFYKSINLGEQEIYDPKAFTKMILNEREAGNIPASFNASEKIAIRIEKV
jgi:hypothetical protein